MIILSFIFIYLYRKTLEEYAYKSYTRSIFRFIYLYICSKCCEHCFQNRPNLETVPDSCGPWTGRFASQTSGHLYAGCDEILADNGYDSDVCISM